MNEADYEKILSKIATQLAPNCGIMNVFVDAWNTQRPVKFWQILEAASMANRMLVDLT